MVWNLFSCCVAGLLRRVACNLYFVVCNFIFCHFLARVYLEGTNGVVRNKLLLGVRISICIPPLFLKYHIAVDGVVLIFLQLKISPTAAAAAVIVVTIAAV